MGVDRTDYLMFGVNVGADNFDWDKHQAEIEGAPERRFDIVYDGMGGEYCVAGKILACTAAYRGEPEMIEIDPDNLDVDRDALAAAVSEAFGQNRCANDFKLIMFSHLS